MLEAGQGFLELNSATTSTSAATATQISMDRSKILTVGKLAIGKFLTKIQVFKATADFDSAKTMYDTYTTVDERMLKLRDEVIACRKPRKLFCQPHLQLNEDSQTVEMIEFPASDMGIVSSFLARFSAEDIACIPALVENEAKHHKYD